MRNAGAPSRRVTETRFKLLVQMSSSEYRMPSSTHFRFGVLKNVLTVLIVPNEFVTKGTPQALDTTRLKLCAAQCE